MRYSVILDLAFVLITLFMAIAGAKRGLIKSIIHSAKWLLGLVFAYFFGGRLGSYIGTTFLEKPIYNIVYQKLDALYHENTAAFNVEEILEKLPKFLLGEELQARLQAIQGSGEELVASLSAELSLPISNFFSNILGYVCVFFMTVFGLWLISKLLTGIIDKIRFLSFTNRLLGAAWGILAAVPILFALASVIKLFFEETPAYCESVIAKFFGESSIFELLHIFNVGSLWLSDLFG